MISRARICAEHTGAQRPGAAPTLGRWGEEPDQRRRISCGVRGRSREGWIPSEYVKDL